MLLSSGGGDKMLWLDAVHRSGQQRALSDFKSNTLQSPDASTKFALKTE